MKVFVLENGSYSDVHVVGVYSSMVGAELAAKHFADCPSIEEYDMDYAVDDMRRGYRLYFVRLRRDTGDVLECHVQESSYGSKDASVSVDVDRNIYTQCWAESDVHAIKIASDRRRVFLSELAPSVAAVDPPVGSTRG